MANEQGSNWSSGLMAPATQIAGGLIGMATANWQDKRQLNQQRKLMDLQIQGQREMSQFEQAQQLKLWEATNFKAQREQMEKAGLNPALMYKQGGPGGTTASQAGSVGGGTAAGASGEIMAGMGAGGGMGLMMKQMEMMNAQIANTQADTNLTNVRATKEAGVDTEKGLQDIAQSKAATEKLIQETNNAKLQAEYQKTLNEMAVIEKGWKDKTLEANLQLLTKQGEQLTNVIEGLVIDNTIKRETADEIIKQARLTTIEQGLAIELQKQGLIKGQADIKLVYAGIKKIAADINNMSLERAQEWARLDQNQKEIEIKKLLAEYAGAATEFNTGTQADIIRWINVYQGFLGAGTSMMKAASGGAM